MNNLIKLFDKAGINYKTDELMKAHTTFKTGGAAKVFVMPESEEKLVEAVKICKAENKEIFVLGNGSNLLVSDEGICDRVVIYICDGFDFVRKIDDTTIQVGAGASLASVCKFALKHELTGLEFAFGIPGSCGGAAVMNAGAYGGEMKDVLVRCDHISFDGEKGCFENEELDLSYRHSAYSAPGYIVTSLTLKLKKGNKEEIEEKMRDLIGRRKDKQPLDYPSAGSVFKRPEGYFAGALIEQSNLKGKRIGGAMVSEKHAGFIINYENATTKDVTDLIKFCQDTVFEKFGVKLETEIKFV